MIETKLGIGGARHWEARGYGSRWFYVSATGRIIGECAQLSDSSYHASADGKSLGRFASELAAKAAVEGAL